MSPHHTCRFPLGQGTVRRFDKYTRHTNPDPGLYNTDVVQSALASAVVGVLWQDGCQVIGSQYVKTGDRGPHISSLADSSMWQGDAADNKRMLDAVT